MKSTKINENLQKIIKKVLDAQEPAAQIVSAMVKAGGIPYLVGGAVRDALLELPVKDLDIEVHGLSLEIAQSILSSFGPVSLVGQAFGVLRLHGLAIDWSLPRLDSAGRHPTVTIDPHMSFENAARRRDCTINAMGINLANFELADPFNGMDDLKNKILRAPDISLFIEDPLRLFRIMQFIGRFEMEPDEKLNAVCAQMDISSVSKERIEAEFDKLLLRSKRPSLGIRWLQKIGRLITVLPELYHTIGIPQNPAWHPEGDVFEHSMQAIDAAALLNYNDDHEKLIILYGTLCHDLGKTTTTKLINGVLRSIGHDTAGVPMAKQLLSRITHRVELIKAVAKLVRHHMAPGLFIKSNAKLPAYKRLALKLAPEVNLYILAKVSLADKRGRNGASSYPLTTQVAEIDLFLEKAQNAKVLHMPEEPIVQGRDLLGIMEPGPRMGQLIKKAYQIQIEQSIHDKQELLKRILS